MRERTGDSLVSKLQRLVQHSTRLRVQPTHVPQGTLLTLPTWDLPRLPMPTAARLIIVNMRVILEVRSANSDCNLSAGPEAKGLSCFSRQNLTHCGRCQDIFVETNDRSCGCWIAELLKHMHGMPKRWFQGGRVIAKEGAPQTELHHNAVVAFY